MRGRLRNAGQWAIERDYSGVRIGSATPSDIDGCLEIKNRLFIFYEFKHGNGQLPTGQRVMLERIVDALTASGKVAAVVVGSHEQTPGNVIECDSVKVSLVYVQGKWFDYSQRDVTVQKATDELYQLAFKSK